MKRYDYADGCMEEMVNGEYVKYSEVEEYIDKLCSLAYIGEHQHEDYTYKHRFEELKMKLRSLDILHTKEGVLEEVAQSV